MKRLFNLSVAETTLVFSMMRKYGGMNDPFPEMEAKRKNGNNGKKNKRKIASKPCDQTVPNLFDFDCEKWKTCTDEKFLQYRIIMKKICEDDK
jgi:hypothetical protein